MTARCITRSIVTATNLNLHRILHSQFPIANPYPVSTPRSAGLDFWMRRRAHKKSKSGCLECKRRHMKCDENRPKCVNCTTSTRCCSYPEATHSSPRSPSASPFGSTVTSNTSYASFVTSPPSATPMLIDSPVAHLEFSPAPSECQNQFVASTVSPAVAEPIVEEATSQPHLANGDVNALHIELLYHLLTEMSECLGRDQNYSKFFSEVVMPPAISHPFLMHEILAISALHLSTLHPARQKHLENVAEELQTKALSLFNQSCQQVTATNCVPMFIFSSLLGNHVFYTTFMSHRNSFSIFLDKFATYLELHRGVRSIIANNWEHLRDIPTKVLMLDDNNQLPAHGQAGGEECESLRRLIDTADLSSATTKTYNEAIINLQWSFDAQRGRNVVGLTFAWPIQLSAEYLELLKQRRPEALIILAYYAVMLHSHRDVWLVGGAGRYLIESISEYLGTSWEGWLALPNAALEESSIS